MKHSRFLIAAALAAATFTAHAQSVDPLTVRSWAASCSNCHGTDGVAQSGMESLAGGNKDEMYKKLIQFKTGKKPATVMHQLSKGYSDQQLEAISAYFAGLKK